MDSAPAPEAPPRRSRLRRILTWTGATFGAFIVVVLLFGPGLIASIVRTQLTATLNDRIDGTSTVGEVSFSWTGGATIRDIDIKDRTGAPLASVKEVSADLSVLSALRGRFIATARVDSPRLEFRRLPDGRLNLMAALKSRDAPAASKPSSPSAPSYLPHLDLTLTVQNAVALIAGEKESTQFDVSGAWHLTHDSGIVSLTGSTSIKEGTVAVAADANLRENAPAPAGRVNVRIDRVPLDARMGPLLELLHPAFSAAGGKLDGFIDGTIDVRHDTPLGKSEDELLNALSGQGTLQIRDCTFAGSQLLGQLMSALAMEKREVKMKPLAFRLSRGRITYDTPWQWTISGSETTFTGSIGFDRTLDLVWHIPVTDELASKLRVAKGQTYEVGIKGTVTRPKLDMKGVARQVAEEKLEEAAKKGLESLLGGKDEKKAEKLLQEADALHGEGKKAEAAAKYRKIKDDYRKTRVYKDNKDRIDPRSED